MGTSKEVWVIHTKNGQTKKIKASYAKKYLLNTCSWIEGEEVKGKIVPVKTKSAK